MYLDESSVVGWRKSSYSPNGGASCVEVGWRTSSYSLNGGGQCVEARRTHDAARVALRDSQNRHHGYLLFPGREWTAFLHAARHGQL